VEEQLLITVTDDGVGLPEGFDPQRAGNLGLQIVRTLVVGELGGSFDMVPAESGGTRVVLEVPVGSAP
jgi:two-component sensor histidine kinase